MVRKALFALGLLLCSSLAAAATRPNLVLITLDSSRADRMGFLGAKSGITPNLDRLAGESLVFEHAYAQAPATVASHATIFSGGYPQSTAMSELGGTLPASLPYLPDLLKAQGYRTAAFVGSIQLDPRNGLAQGFDRGFQGYDASFHPAIPGDTRAALAERPADQVVGRALAWLARNPQGPFFVWIHINDPHAPNASYNAAIAAADAAIGKLLAALKQQKLYATTAVLVAADHGESLGAHGEDTHGIFLYDETIHVPLLLKLPEAQPTAKHVTAKVRLVDIAPTLLEVAAVPVPSQMQGQSLLRIAKSSSADQPVYSRSDLPQRGFGWSALESWRAGKYLYIRAPQPELYDLTADPGATRNLAQSSKATLDTMAAQLESFDRRLSGEGGKPSGAQLSSSEMQKLASLGYVGLQKPSGASTAATGTDPKDKIATANKTSEAARALAQGKADRAVAALTPLVAAESGLYLAEYTLGTALAQKGQHAEAVKHLHKAIELQPDSAWAHYQMGTSLLKTGDFKTAAVHLEIAAGRLSGFAAAHLSLAETYAHLGRAEDAKRERTKAK
ncbi:MAG: sulfatase-like hydrolase/transferase [Acidobacteriales bacterium]|nr:sulfatase-like hydrolase/transferase [Terriglobales bacterium]